MTACEKLTPDDVMGEIDTEKAREVADGKTFIFTIKGDF